MPTTVTAAPARWNTLACLEKVSLQFLSLCHLLWRPILRPVEADTKTAALEHLPKRLNRGVPLRERIGFKVRTGMEASMDGETVFGGSAWARCWCGARWRYHPGNCGATWSEYQLCRALP